MRHLLFASLVAVAACGGTESSNPEEVITTVILTFTPAGGGAARTFEFDDPDGDGGEAPVVDDVDIAAGDYDVTVGFENRLEDPPEVITEEVADEGDEHMVFFTGDAVDGPASDNPGAPLTHDYADEDAEGLPIGLENTITAAAGTGTLTVTLRHMPPVNEQAVKTADTAADVAAGGFSAIGGSSDVQVDFAVNVP
jgi:hypothetical protein